jgi:hypothetical protein
MVIAYSHTGATRAGGQGRSGMTAGTFGLLGGQGGIEPDEPRGVCLVELGDGFP